MHALISGFRSFLADKVGRCGTCMRQALTAALAAWVAFGAAAIIAPDGLAQSLAGLTAVFLTALWLLHVAAYAARTRRETGVDPAGRRRALGLLARAVAAGVAASAPVLLWPAQGFAFCGQCTKNADCGVGFVCKNTAPVNSGKVCNECVRA